MRKVGPEAGKSSTGECYYIQIFGDTVSVVIRARNFSVYAFGVSDEPVAVSATSSSGGSGGGTSNKVTTPETKHGKVTVSPSNPATGSNVTVTVTPDEGYQLGTLTITDSNGNAVEYKDNGDGTYTFVMPDGGVRVEATFVLACKRDETCPMYTFTDADRQAWYHDGIHYCIEHKLMEGTGAGTFSPNGITTRAQLVTILWRMEGEPVVNYQMAYKDVEAENWYAEAIRWATSEKIVDGYGDAFGPNDPVTREQTATILYRYSEYKGIDVRKQADLSGYTDGNTVSSWASKAMRWAVSEGLITGTGVTTLAPKTGSTRAMAATILMRYCEEIVKK